MPSLSVGGSADGGGAACLGDPPVGPQLREDGLGLLEQWRGGDVVGPPGALEQRPRQVEAGSEGAELLRRLLEVGVDGCSVVAEREPTRARRRRRWAWCSGATAPGEASAT